MFEPDNMDDLKLSFGNDEDSLAPFKGLSMGFDEDLEEEPALEPKPIFPFEPSSANLINKSKLPSVASLEEEVETYEQSSIEDYFDPLEEPFTKKNSSTLYEALCDENEEFEQESAAEKIIHKHKKKIVITIGVLVVIILAAGALGGRSKKMDPIKDPIQSSSTLTPIQNEPLNQLDLIQVEPVPVTEGVLIDKGVRIQNGRLTPVILCKTNTTTHEVIVSTDMYNSVKSGSLGKITYNKLKVNGNDMITNLVISEVE